MTANLTLLMTEPVNGLFVITFLVGVTIGALGAIFLFSRLPSHVEAEYKSYREPIILTIESGYNLFQVKEVEPGKVSMAPPPGLGKTIASELPLWYSTSNIPKNLLEKGATFKVAPLPSGEISFTQLRWNEFAGWQTLAKTA